MLMMTVEITLLVPVEAETEEAAEEILRSMSNADLFELYDQIGYDYYLAE